MKKFILEKIKNRKNITYICIFLLSFYSVLVFAQQGITITGTVTDSGEPLPGVSIRVKNTPTGTATDVNGRYTLTVPSEEAVLVFSFIGYATQELPVGNRRVIDLELAEDTRQIEEVVVVGYGTQKKINLTGSVASVSDTELTKRPAPSVQNLLQGKVSGMQINQSGGTPGLDNGTIRIRGVGTFSSAGSDPLVLVDGVQGSLANVDPDNIESVSVLKDAASAAIYGARAANGVILVTTKRGNAKEISVEYHVTLEAQKATMLPDLLYNSADYMMYWNEANARSGFAQYFSQAEIDAFRNNPNDPVHYPNFNWTDYMFKTAFSHNHHLSVSGGNEKTTFNLSIGFFDQDGITRGPYEFKRYNMLLSVDTKVTDWLTVGGNIQGSKREISQDIQGKDNETYWIMHIFGPGPNYTPTMTLPDGSTGYVARYSNNIGEWTVRNPMAIIAAGINTRDIYTVRPQLYANVKFMDGLNWYTKFATNFDYEFRKNHEYPIDCYYFNDGTFSHNNSPSTLGVRNNMYTTLLTTLYSTLNYQKTFADAHSVGAMLGYSQESSYSRELAGSRTYFPTESLSELNAGSSLNQSTGGTASEWAIQSLFGRINYDYLGKYLIEANFRYDGTSRIAPDTRWGLFPSFSGAWRISEEGFMKDVKWLNNLKLRASWGELGNQNVGTYPYQDVLSTTSYPFGTLESGVRPTRLVDKTLSWETTTVTDFGVDLNVKNGLFSMTVDWYKKLTDGILYQIPIPASVGLSAPTVNGGQMQNIGWDFEVGHAYHIGEVNYNVNLNLSTYKNKVLSIISPTLGNNIVQEGLPYNAWYFVEWEGIFQNQAEIDNSPIHPFNPKPGDLKYKDQNGDGRINADDRVVVDGYYPKFYYGGSFDFFWRNFDLSIFFQGVAGTRNYLGGMHRAWGYAPFAQGSPPTMDFVKNHWTGDGSTNKYPAMFEQTYNPMNGTANTWWLLDNSYMRLKNLRFGYNFPTAWANRIGLKGLQVYLTGDNLLTFTSYPGLDPEKSSLGSGYSTYPNISTYAFGLKVKL